MLADFHRGLNDGRPSCPVVLAYRFLSTPYKFIPFLSWSKSSRETIWYELRNLVCGSDGKNYFVG